MTDPDSEELAPPSDWNPAEGIVCLLGLRFRALALRLAKAGERRILLVLDPHEPRRIGELGENPIEMPWPIHVCRGEGHALQTILEMAGTPPLRAWIPSPDSSEEARARAHAFSQRLEHCLRAKHLQFNTITQAGAKFVEQTLENLATIAEFPSIDGLDDAFEGRPCVIVSPGPSLSKNLHLLKDLKGRALLLTGTHALGAFAHSGVSPDLVLSADAGDLARHLRGCDLTGIAASLVGVTCQPETFQAARACGSPRLLTFGANHRLDHWIFEPLGENAGLPTGGSVACSAFSLALRLGCDPIIFVGQDLSFPDGRFYAQESLDGTSEVVLGEGGTYHLEKPPETTDEYGGGRLEDGTLLFTLDRPTVQVPGYHGGTVLTSEPFRAFLVWFEACIENLAGSVRVWNATEGGAHIAGASQLSLAEVIAKLPEGEPLDAGEVLDHKLANFDASNRRSALLAFARATLDAIQLAGTFAKRCIDLAEEAASDAWTLSRLDQAERQLRAAARPIGCLSLITQKAILDSVERARVATTLEENLAASNDLCRAFRDATSFLEGPLSDAVDVLESLDSVRGAGSHLEGAAHAEE